MATKKAKEITFEKAIPAFLKYLADEGKLPVFGSSETNYEAHQPPLYYVLAIPFLWLSHLVGSLKAMRVLAVLSGGAMVVCTYLVAKRAYPEDEGVPLLAGAIVAFLPSQLTLNASVGNDSLAALMFSGFSLWVASRRGRTRAGGAMGIGALLGLAMLTKLTCLVPVVLAPVAILIAPRAAKSKGETSSRLARKTMRKGSRGKKNASRRPRAAATQGRGWSALRTLLVAGAAALIICGWWLVRNQVLYGDPFALRVFQEVFGKDRPTPEYFLSRGFSAGTYAELVGVYTFRSFWGTFGQANIFLPGSVYWICLAVSVWIVAGWIRRGWEGRRGGGPAAGTGLGRWILLLQIALLAASFLRFNVTFFQAQARYLLPAATAIAIFMALGMLCILPNRWRKAASILLSAAFFGYGVAALLMWGLPGYSAGG